MIFDQILTIAICLYHEARGETKEGKIAVAHVILNRVRQSDTSVRDVIYKPYQFSWANAGKRPPITDYAALSDCFEAAIDCFAERLEGKDLKDADHYFADYIPVPKWAEGMTQIVKIGKHLFYRSKRK